MKKYSKQRQLIYNSLKNRTDHPTAEQLYEDLKLEMPRIGIATVYRNLIELCESGEVIKLKSLNGPDRYDGNNKPHIHFECNKCNTLYDIFLNENDLRNMDNTINKISSLISAKPEKTFLTITGKCGKCT